MTPLEESAGGESSALFPLVYAELRKIAHRYLARERPDHTLQPTALVHEAWLRLQRQDRVRWQGRTHVLAVGAQAMRRLLVDHARARHRAKRGAGQAPVPLNADLDALAPALSADDALAIDEALTRLAALDARQARVVELRCYGGMTSAEIAEALGVSTRTVEGDWMHARAWLRRELATHLS